MVELFEELKRYVGFTAADEDRLREIGPRLEPVFTEIVEHFYARILEHPDAAAALQRGERHVGHLKITLRRWLGELFQGPWDADYVERRARIGRVHVHIALPQHYMISAMNLLRVHLRDHLGTLVDVASPHGAAIVRSVQRILDLDLALMLHTYREDLEARNARAERLATFGQLVGSIGHELRNPLGVIETSLYVLKSRPHDDPRVTKHLDRIGHQVTVANQIITQLLTLIREQPLSAQPVKLAEIVAEVATSTQLPPGVTLHLVGEDSAAQVRGDPTQLRQVLVNLVDNAVHAASPVGAVRITLEQPTESEVTLTVDDSGPGVDPSLKGRLFEPLVSTKPKGIGLGLALVRRILDRHGGTIDVGRGPLGGARFTARLPAGADDTTSGAVHP